MESNDLVIRWVAESPAEQLAFRQCVHTLLMAIAHDPFLRSHMILKGGILMALRYRSPRFTTDLDFSSQDHLADVRPETVSETLGSSLAMMVAQLDYGLDCRVQGIRVQPADSPEYRFPNIELKIAYAYRGSPGHKRLTQGRGTQILTIDFNLNEPILAVEELKIDGGSFEAYALTDLISEKLRSLLQQVLRHRNRRQDIFDVAQLLKHPISEEQKKVILDSLKTKANSRAFEPLPTSFSDPELRERAEKEYHTLSDEMAGDLPDFDVIFREVREFYESLPWNAF